MQATIRNEFLTLTVDTHGAEAVSLKNAAGEEMLWQADKAVWARHAPILFPWTGKLVGGSFTHNGREYKGGQHGFARDVEHSLVRAEGDTIVLELRANEETKARFPFDFTLTSTFVLDGKTVRHTLRVQNNGEEPLRFGIGYHPAFNVPFDDAHTTEDYEFRFEREESPVILDARPNGLLSGKSYYQWKNASAIQLTDDLFANDSFCMAGLRSHTLGIYEKDTGRHISCDIAGYPYTLIWSALSEKIHFVCIEPWHSLPAAETDPKEWNERAAAATLQTGETFETTLATTFAR
jgi:galactose mutarotase-like enzyme